MNHTVPAEVSAQVRIVVDVIKSHLEPVLLAIHLYGSALHGGLKKYSDIDLLVTLSARPNETTRRALVLELLQHSAPPAESKSLRALEVTVVAREEVVPWRNPARRELQFGEWLRAAASAGHVEPPCLDPDLAILLTKVRQHSVPLAGPPAEDLFDPVPESDFLRVLAETTDLWHSPQDWEGDERNVVLTLARIWYSAATLTIAPKDAASRWALERLPSEHKSVLQEACNAYLGYKAEDLASRPVEVAKFIRFVKDRTNDLLASKNDA